MQSDELSRLPRTFGRYTLFDFVGKGGMAELFLARVTNDLGTARLFVVKEILPEFSENARFAEMLIHEAKLAARLTHANIVTVFDLGRENGRLFITMEYVEGFDIGALLRRCTKRKIPLPLDLALTIVCGTLRGLDYAHRRTDDDGRPLGIVHRDVSPSNVLVSFGGDVKVCDFGIAHANDAVIASTPSLDEAAIKGKAGYMSPEQAEGAPIDARADVFAAGILLWELLSGHKLYRAEEGGRADLLAQARRAEIPDLPKKGLPEEAKLHAICKRALSKDPAQRPSSAQALLMDLEAYAIETGQLASSIKLGDWLTTTFGEEALEHRRVRERAAAAIQRGPLVELRPIERTPAPAPAVVVPQPAPNPAPPAHAAPAEDRPPPPVELPRPPAAPVAVAAPPSIAGTSVSVPPEATSSSRLLPTEPREQPGVSRTVVALVVIVVVVVVIALMRGP